MFVLHLTLLKSYQRWLIDFFLPEERCWIQNGAARASDDESTVGFITIPPRLLQEQILHVDTILKC